MRFTLNYYKMTFESGKVPYSNLGQRRLRSKAKLEIN